MSEPVETFVDEYGEKHYIVRLPSGLAAEAALNVRSEPTRGDAMDIVELEE
jgi:hypothetical protein